MTTVNNRITFNTDYLQNALDSMNLSNTASSAPLFGGSASALPASFDTFGAASGLGSANFMPSFNFGGFQMPTFQLPDFSQMFANACSQMNSYNAMRNDFITSLFKNGAFNFNNYKFNTNTNLPGIKEVGYDADLGLNLAKTATNFSNGRSIKRCAQYVSDAMERCGVLGERGDAYELEHTLRKNKNFKEIKVNSAQELKNLPAGCVVVYPKGSAGYSSQYGHVEIAMGNGAGVSDFVNRNMRYAPDIKVFVPVSA